MKYEHKQEIKSLKNKRIEAQANQEYLKEKFVKETKNNKFVRLPVIENSNNDYEILDKLKDK